MNINRIGSRQLEQNFEQWRRAQKNRSGLKVRVSEERELELNVPSDSVLMHAEVSPTEFDGVYSHISVHPYCQSEMALQSRGDAKKTKTTSLSKKETTKRKVCVQEEKQRLLHLQ